MNAKLNTKLNVNSTYVILDTETTGLTKESNVLTVSLIVADKDFKILDTLHILIKYPFYTVFIAALQVNKIDLIQHNKNAVTQKEATNLIKEFLYKYFNNDTNNNKCKLIGHNIIFDLNMLKNNLIIGHDILKEYVDDILDTYTISKKLKKNKIFSNNQSLSLNKLCYYFDITRDVELLFLNNNYEINSKLNYELSKTSFHNSYYDSIATLFLYKELSNLM
jgi:DNA polymerase III alpha subunit (gram-positive type)